MSNNDFIILGSGNTPQLFVSQPPQLGFLQADSSQLQPHFDVLDASLPQWVQPPPLQLSSLQVVAPQLLLPSQPGCVQAESPQFVLLQPYAAPAPTLWNEQSVLSLEPPQSLVETNEVQISDDDGQGTERSILQPPLEELSSMQPQPAPETPPCGELHPSVSVEAPSDIVETDEVQVLEEHGDTEERNTHLQKVSEEHGDGEERDVPQPPLREHLLAEDPLLECENASINQKRALVANTDDADGKETNDMGVLCKKIRPTTRVQKKHAGDRRFACDLCSSSFTHKTNLTRHIRNHNGERPFKCCVCDASFMYKWVLNTHMRTHTGERPYACSVCNASFNVKQSLICHMRVHTGERPFVCSVCNAWFLHKDTLVNHMRTHTGSARM